MARGFYNRPYIAAGYNNAANMQPYYKLGTDPDCGDNLFDAYRGDNAIIQRFFPNEGTQQTGDDRQVPIGLPYCELEFAVITNNEYNHLADTFASNRLDGPVTIRAYDFENKSWGNYNAIMQLNTQDRSQVWNGWEWRPFIIRFIKMREI